MSINTLNENELAISSLSLEEERDLSGGLIEPISLGIGAVAGLVYLYDWGYNYAKARL